MRRLQKIFTLNKALLLSDMGNKILYSEPNKKYPQFQVFIFKNTKKLQEDWKTINK